MTEIHGYQEGAPDERGRVSFVLFWRRADGPKRGQQFRADPAHYPDVVWHPSEIAARDAAWGKE